ncbi:hypothetical protein [Arcobacter aquimarinus]|uniref:Uncharacterized protein n=1 Tax=Arcobacter aquimarinus TaxID=1315211 RepID=A0AAE7E1P0_9BACT|nr:hypothetical protein [Arcobacter aquimarinus]QKE26107.1 hypothetical protein AAQM_1358 [Arcobacter aquimarinus]RXI36217.1 hypothetical protein CP986_03030 [Arcobacter aquimarinus]
MKNILFLISLITFGFSSQYTFLIDKYDEEMELEAKIISNISTALKKDKIKLFIPKISNVERDIYSKFFTIVDDCKDANFIFEKRSFGKDSYCEDENKLFFTNNYQKLLHNKSYIGAFFWNKSRPNIILVKNRLLKENINLSSDYEKFIEDIR